MKKFRFGLLLLLVASLFITSQPVSAQQSVCEICGYCAGAKVPANWGSCIMCLYPAAAGMALANNPEAALSVTPPPGDNVYTVFGCISTTQGGFVSFFANFLTSLTTGLALLGILWGGLKVMTARGDREALEEGKHYVYGSIIGLLIVFFATFIVKTIGIEILKIPFLQ